MSPTITAVVSTFNRRDGLMQCLDSLEQQTLGREQYEIIVVDDHSSDDTEELVKKRATIRYFRQAKNRGLSASRNVGIQNARGEWVLFLDDDLYLHPNLLERHLQVHQEQPGEHVAVLGHTRYAPSTEVTPFMQYLWDSGRSPLIDPELISNPDDVPFGNLHTNTSVHREMLVRVGMVDEELPYGEDTELAYRLKKNGMRLVFREDILADHYGTLTYRYARRRAKIAGKTAVLTHRKHPEWIDIEFLKYGAKSRGVIRAKRIVTEALLDPLLTAADNHRLDHPLLRRAFGFALGTHQLTAMIDTAKPEELSVQFVPHEA